MEFSLMFGLLCCFIYYVSGDFSLSNRTLSEYRGLAFKAVLAQTNDLTPCSSANFLERVEGDCTKFKACGAAGVFIMNCPAGLVFSQVQQICNYKVFVPECQNTQTTDICSPNPCLNGVCVQDQSLINGYRCYCNYGYYGEKCGNYNYCLSLPCQNNGACTNSDSGYTCDCASTGFTGLTCTDPIIRSCSYNNCINGYCNNNICNCYSGYTGSSCNITSTSTSTPSTTSSTTTSAPTSTISPQCDPNPCLNGGTCMGGAFEYSCQCPTGYSGSNCQIFKSNPNCTYPCPSDVPSYNYPSWNDTSCSSYYTCQRGVLSYRTCQPGYKFDVVSMSCRDQNEDNRFFCDFFKGVIQG